MCTVVLKPCRGNRRLNQLASHVPKLISISIAENSGSLACLCPEMIVCYSEANVFNHNAVKFTMAVRH